MGDARRRKEIALQRNREYDSDPVINWTMDDKKRLETTFGRFLEPDFLKRLTQSGFKEMGRGAVMFSILEGRPEAVYVPASSILLTLYESGFKNRLQKTLEEYDPENYFVLVVTYNDLAKENDNCIYDYVIRSF